MADVATGGVDQVLAAARERIERAEPHEAWAATVSGDALIVDLRSSDERRRNGIVPGSIHVPRSVLEWRVDPASGWSNPHLAEPRRLILLCAEGFSSSLAAASLLDLGRGRAGDVVGGVRAWRAAGLPLVPAPEEEDAAALPGMGTPAPRRDSID